MNMMMFREVDFALFGFPKITETKDGYTLKSKYQLIHKPLSSWILLILQ